MRLAELTEASYDSRGKGSLDWYLSTFFVHQPDAYDESGIKYYIVKDPYDVFVEGRQVEAVELDTYMKGQGYGSRAVSLHVYQNIGVGSRKQAKNYIHDFGEHVEIKETRDVDLPKWVGSRG